MMWGFVSLPGSLKKWLKDNVYDNRRAKEEAYEDEATYMKFGGLTC